MLNFPADSYRTPHTTRRRNTPNAFIRMYLGKKEHQPPHFHASYQGTDGVIDMLSFTKMNGLRIETVISLGKRES